MLCASERTKVCTKCKLDKPLNRFGKHKKAKDGLNWHCKDCLRVDRKERYWANREKAIEDSIRWQKENKDRYIEYMREYHKKNKKRINAATNKWEKEHKDRANERKRRWVEDNTERNRENKRLWIRGKLATDRKYQLTYVMRRLLYRTLTVKNTQDRVTTMLGYTHLELKARLEFQFESGMSWDNYGEWEIDHKIPVSHFVGRGETRPHIINALSNLQPLWKADNRAKRDKLIYMEGVT